MGYEKGVSCLAIAPFLISSHFQQTIMQHEVYKDLYINEGFSVIDFFSIGWRGVVPKRIIFTPTRFMGIYSLTFGDVDIKGNINDYSISDNGDRNKILATVIHAIDTYLNYYPDRMIFFTGSTKVRTRLYRMVIGLNLDYLSHRFEIYCQTDTGIITFQKNLQVQGFLIRRKL
jgi:hypothetical protein